MASPATPQFDPNDLGKALEFGVGTRPLTATPSSDGSILPIELEQKLIAVGNQLVLEGEKVVWDHRRKRALNMAFFRDQHQARWDDMARAIDLTPRMPKGYDARIFLNIYKAIIVTAVARFEGMNPQVRVRAGSSDQSAIEAAASAEKILRRYEWRMVRMDERIVDALWHMILLDTAIWKVEWDPNAGKIIGEEPVYLTGDDGQPLPQLTMDQMTGELVPATDEMGQPIYQQALDEKGQPKTLVKREGGNRVSTVHPNDFLVDPTVADYEDSNYVVHSNYLTPAEVFRRYGVVVPPSSDNGVNRRASVRTRRYAAPKTVRVCEVWVKRGPYAYGDKPGEMLDFPNGCMWAFANNRLLEFSDNPYQHGMFPFVFMPCLKIPEQVFGDTIANSLRVCQVAINKIWHQILDILNKMGAPIILESADAPLAEKDKSNIPRVVAWQPTGRGSIDKPEQWSGIAAPPGMYQAAAMILDIMRQMAGWQEGGMAGGAPANIEANAAFQTLTANDMARLTSTAHSLARGIERALTMMMWNIRQFWTEQRAVTVTGDVTSTETIELMGSQILDTFAVEVIDSSIIPQTREQKWQKAFSQFQGGIFGNPASEEARRKFKLMVGDDEGDEASLETLFVHRAKVENLQILTTGMCQTTPAMLSAELSAGAFAIKMEEHLKALMSDRFQKNPQAAAGMLQWMKITSDIYEEMMMAAMPPPEPPEGEDDKKESGSESSEPSDSQQQPTEAAPEPAQA